MALLAKIMKITFSLLPPNLDVLTDEEEGGDDKLYENKLPRNVSGNTEGVTFKHTIKNVWITDNDETLQTNVLSTSWNIQKKSRIETSVKSANWRTFGLVYSFFPS